MIELFAGHVEVHYGQAYIELAAPFDGAMDDSFRGQSNGLIGAQNPDILFLTTGLHTGPIGLAIYLHETDPGLDERWEEITEVSFHAPNGAITLVEWTAEHGLRMALPQGNYRARYQGRGMGEASELDTNIEDAPVDTYRLDLWSAEAMPDRVVKQTSEIAAYWHDWARSLVAST